MASVQPPGFPVAVKAAVVDVGGSPTDVVVSRYADGTFLVATQIGAFGTILRARWGGGGPGAGAPGTGGPGRPAASLLRLHVLAARRRPSSAAARRRPDASDEGRTTYSTAVLLGRRDEPLLALAARQLVEAAAEAGSTKCGALAGLLVPRARAHARARSVGGTCPRGARQSGCAWRRTARPAGPPPQPRHARRTALARPHPPTPSHNPTTLAARRPLTVAIGLKEHTPEAIRQLVAAVKEGGLLR
jgi:hypothetical protein